MGDLDSLAAAVPSTYPRRRRPKQNNRGLFVFVAVLAVICFLGAVCVFSGSGSSPTQSPTNRTSLKAGDKAFLYLPEAAGDVIVAKDERASSAIDKASRAKDGTGLMALVMADQAYLVEANTMCLVIQPGVMEHEVRVLGGRNVGKSGLIPVEWVHQRPRSK